MNDEQRDANEFTVVAVCLVVAFALAMWIFS